MENDLCWSSVIASIILLCSRRIFPNVTIFPFTVSTNALIWALRGWVVSALPGVGKVVLGTDPDPRPVLPPANAVVVEAQGVVGAIATEDDVDVERRLMFPRSLTRTCFVFLNKRTVLHGQKLTRQLKMDAKCV